MTGFTRERELPFRERLRKGVKRKPRVASVQGERFSSTHTHTPISFDASTASRENGRLQTKLVGCKQNSEEFVVMPALSLRFMFNHLSPTLPL